MDRRLYAWLGESEENKFERAFSAYFSVAFPAVVRHLMRISRWDPTQLEELAQDALLRFFERVGRGRREASGSVQQAITRVRPLSLGPFHEKQVNHWARDVSSFRDSAMRFQLPQMEEPDGNWKAQIHAVANRIPVLSQQGCYILNAARVELRWECADARPAEATPVEAEERIAGDLVETTDDDGVERYVAAKEFANAIAAEAAVQSARAQVALTHHPRIVEFVDGTFTIVRALPRLRIPTNGYLFEIAMTIYLDECKKRGRQKRGGPGTTPSTFTVATATLSDAPDSQHPIDILTLDSDTPRDGAEHLEDAPSITANDSSAAYGSPLSIDPTLQYENEDLFEKFYEYLRKPVADATQTYENAVGSERGRAERQRLDSLANKFARTTAVLSLMGEGYTQEQIAEQLILSRNQVKYIIELVQEAFVRFAADPSRHSTSALQSREHSNAR